MTDERSLPSPDHLFTWVDLDEYFTALATRRGWPAWLLEVDAYWDGVEFTVADGTSPDDVWDWLASRLGPLTVDRDDSVLLLEGLGGEGRPLDVRFCSTDQMPSVARQLRWTERRIVRQLADGMPPPTDPLPHDVQFCAFHSFKGGVGRTLHCVALARELVRRRHVRRRVLLVDADLEAPGISWMLAAQGSRTDFALHDFLALLHGSNDDGWEAVALARKFLLNQEYDGVVILPTTRDPMRIGPPRIEPSDLLAGGRPAYFLTESLARLAHAVDADAVVVDLRAGTSELSAPVLLDPRVQRVFVTTLSDQSVRGTEHLLRELGHRAPSRRSSDPVCAVLMTQFVDSDHDTELSDAADRLREAISATVRPSADDTMEGTDLVDRDVVAQPIRSPFVAPLLALPASWDEVRDRIDQVGLGAVVDGLAEAIRPEQVRVPETGNDLRGRRERLAELARRITFAETAEDDDAFLPTEALVDLVSTHRTEAPIEVVVGAKGSGKTFTYLRMCRKATWAAFGSVTGVNNVELDAPLVPALASRNLSPALDDVVSQIRRRGGIRLSGREPEPFLTVRDLVAEHLDRDVNEVQWRRVWLACLARAVGMEATPEEAESALTSLARDRHAVFVVDGLEDVFQDFSTDARQQKALRALLVDCPEWLRSLRGRPLGLVVFVRRDLVLNSVQQNVQQFLERYRRFELRWNATEALRLVAWTCEQAGVLPQVDGGVRSATSSALSRHLTALWGSKLGSDRSREARSQEWFLAALSDFNLQVQARDIVSFLAGAARGSVDDIRWSDRLLTPTAMRRALPQCSSDKVAAIEAENVPVRALFERLKGMPDERRKVPFTLESVGLDPADARLLEANGVLFRENDQYWMPEIYRHGLEFVPGTVGRPRVVSINNAIRSRRMIG